MSNNLIIRNSANQYSNNVVQKKENAPCSQQQPNRKIIHGYALPQIALRNEEKGCAKRQNEVLLVNGCWDTSNKIPNIVAEMHNIQAEDIKAFQGTLSGDSRDFLNPSPRGSDSGIESDCTDGNLSWLLNYRIHELPPVPDSASSTSDPLSLASAALLPSNNDNLLCPDDPLDTNDINSKSRDFAANSTGKPQSYRYTGPKKPPFTYTELIEHALSEKGELTVSGIYQWISEHFPFYKQNDDRWKNSVRHNLSINPHFRKGSKAVHGAGHLWTIAQRDERKSWQIKQRMQQFMQTTANNKEAEQFPNHQEIFDMELQTATASILEESFDFDQNELEPKQENIEVEFINVIDMQTGMEDFLSPPVSKQQIVQECGLGSDFLITDLNPNALGINLAEGEVVNDGHLYDDISFEYYELEKE